MPIFATSSTEVEAAGHATETIPIVFATHADPVSLGHVASLARPAGNITGLSGLVTELAAKELEILKQALPHMTRFGGVDFGLLHRLPRMPPRWSPNSSAFRFLRFRSEHPRISMGLWR